MGTIRAHVELLRRKGKLRYTSGIIIAQKKGKLRYTCGIIVVQRGNCTQVKSLWRKGGKLRCAADILAAQRGQSAVYRGKCCGAKAGNCGIQGKWLWCREGILPCAGEVPSLHPARFASCLRGFSVFWTTNASCVKMAVYPRWLPPLTPARFLCLLNLGHHQGSWQTP